MVRCYTKSMTPDLVIFDGSNFYHGSKNLSPETHLTNFDYPYLVEIITGSKNFRIEYCVGEIRQERNNPRSKVLYAQQQSLFYNLEKQKIKVKKGYMLKKNDEYDEKGVDVQIAVDIVRGAIKKEYGKCFVISSDTDILPAILDAKTEGKQIIYVGFENFISRAMKANCGKTILITKKMILQCAKKGK